MRSIGHKVKGSIQVAHGLGENIRGTALGAVDTITNSQTTRNDEIAQRGRQEIQDGLTNIRGVSTAQSGHGHAPWTASQQSGSSYGNSAAPNEFPQHHRDDAISNDSDAISVGKQYENNPAIQGSTAASEGRYPTDQYQSSAGGTNTGFYHEQPGFPVAPEVQRGGQQPRSDFVA